jgi:anti-sigma regulatory factor (Ser/Thr protein kinase)
MIRSLDHEFVTASFPPALQSPGRAREFVVGSLRAADMTHPTMTDRASLVTSELVTNAVVHACTNVEVRVAIDDTDVWLEVIDEGPTRPYRPPPSPMDSNGRGLVLVDAVADGWGVADVEGGLGKMVWARLSRS